ncbi:MAG TPA: FkbM family methyltransferase [Candidatus Bathyarchaeia archaeon]|nr:FkbM family methyltransferase [Candidatus Bathyarchaeia archaeon]
MRTPDWKWILEWKLVYPIRHGHSYTKYYELAVRQAMFSMSGRSFWDVGANTGYYTIPLAAKFDEVTAFEPDSTAIGVLRQKISKAGLGNVKIVPLALSDSAGTSKLYLSTKVRSKSIGSSNSLIAPPKTGKTGAAGEKVSDQVSFVEVKTDTIDHILGHETVDLMKIDVEGAEFLVLMGGRKTLEELRIKNLVVELHDQKRKNELDDLFDANHYVTKWLDFRPENTLSHVLAKPAR